ncbi:MAG: hypothetical protein QNI92_14980 [Desulfobacterales bacterium]|nr:hypothetical protein [Desulfobacterales bacterium]
MFKTVPVEKAVGMILGHDVTRIEPGKSKGPAFKKGAVIKPEDIPTLLDIGKKHIMCLIYKTTISMKMMLPCKSPQRWPERELS